MYFVYNTINFREVIKIPSPLTISTLKMFLRVKNTKIDSSNRSVSLTNKFSKYGMILDTQITENCKSKENILKIEDINKFFIIKANCETIFESLHACILHLQ